MKAQDQNEEGRLQWQTDPGNFYFLTALPSLGTYSGRIICPILIVLIAKTRHT
jgi:hypothetical protein